MALTADNGGVEHQWMVSELVLSLLEPLSGLPKKWGAIAIPDLSHPLVLVDGKCGLICVLMEIRITDC